MKMNNEHVKKITQIKQYLFDPPVSFKLNDYAISYLEDAIAVMTPYPYAASTIENLKLTLHALQHKTIASGDLRKELLEAGKKLSNLTCR